MVGVSLWGCSGEVPRPGQLVSFDGARASPTATLDVELSATVDPHSVERNVALLRGEADAAALHLPLSAKEVRNAVAVVVEAAGAHVLVTPRRALVPEERYTLVLGAKLVVGESVLGRPLVLDVETSSLDEAAPLIELAGPLDGDVDVPRNLRAVRIGFSRPVQAPDDVALVDESGATFAAHAESDSSETRLVLDAVLAPGARYSVRAGPSVVSNDGQPVFGDPPGFMTGTMVRDGPVVLRGFDVQTSDRCVVARFQTDDLTDDEICASGVCVSAGPLRSHEAAIPVGSGAPIAVSARAWDETTRPDGQQQATVAAPPDLSLALTEVLTRPLGPRLSQQFVELYNYGATAVDLDGATLHTSSGANALPSAILPAGGYALVVPSGYVVGAGGDPAPATGTVMLYVDESHLGGHGIRVDGEPVWIEDSSGRVVTRWGGYALKLRRGQSVRRTSASACDVAASFSPTPSGGSTPGGP
jgi:hypothetical protein